MFPVISSTTFKYDENAVGKKSLYVLNMDRNIDQQLRQKGFPVITFPDSCMTDKNILSLIEIALKSQKIYLLFTNTDSGKMFASNIGRQMVKEGLRVFLGELPDSYDLAQDDDLKDFKQCIVDSEPMLDRIIARLPNNYQMAAPYITEHLSRAVFNLELPAQKHYHVVIAKRIGSKANIVAELLNSSKPDEQEAREVFKAEVVQEAEKLSKDPKLFLKRIDAVNAAGVVGERRNIAVLYCTLDSRLLRDNTGAPGQTVLATKISGHQGSGKSYSLMTTLDFYPAHAYAYCSSASQQSLHYLQNGIKHKCLVFAEAYQLTQNNAGCDLNNNLRLLLSEGKLKKMVAEKTENGYVTREKVLEGPASFITTTIEDHLEAQLDDRMLNIHPDESYFQTAMIIEASGKKAAGQIGDNCDDAKKVWRAFHDRLEPVAVLIPFAVDISDYFNKTDNTPPINARRAFNKVLNVIRVVTCAYQFQRTRDHNKNLKAEIQDYWMAIQIISNIFQENLGELPKLSSERLDYIRDLNYVSISELVTHLGVTKPAVSRWVKNMIAEGNIKWVDAIGKDFPDEKTFNKAKRSGNARVAVVDTTTNPWESFGLPSPYDLTGDEDWDQGGKLYEMYNLHLDEFWDDECQYFRKPSIIKQSVQDTLRGRDPEGYEESRRDLI